MTTRGRDYRYAWRNGPRWALEFIREGRVAAAIRTLWLTLIRGWICETCQDCGRSYPLWHARDDVYGRVTGRWPHPDGEAGGGLFCFGCFDRMAERQGISIIWQPEVYPGTGWSSRCDPRVQLPASAPILDLAAFRAALRAGVAKASRAYSNDEFADFLVGYVAPTVVSIIPADRLAATEGEIR